MIGEVVLSVSECERVESQSFFSPKCVESQENMNTDGASVQEEDSRNRIQRWTSVVDARQSCYGEDGTLPGQMWKPGSGY